MNILLLCHSRGWNKCTGMIKGLKLLNHRVFLVSDHYWPDQIESFEIYRAELFINSTYDIKQILLDVKEVDVVYSLTEDLLPLQCKLEQYYGLSNLYYETAQVLSDKQKFDNHCKEIGFGELIPDSVIPVCHEDLDIFKDKGIFVKPTVGSGMRCLTPYKDYEYTSFKNKNSFMKELGPTFFKDNKQGFAHPDFNNIRYHLMAQECLSISTQVFGLYTRITKKGIPEIIFWLSIKLEDNQVISHRSINENEVPIKLVEIAKHFLSTFVTSLEIKDMIFSGPDFYMYDGNIKIIDLNPRPGGGISFMDQIHDNELFSSILQDKFIPLRKHFLWTIANIKPGKIKSISDISHLKPYIRDTSLHQLKPGYTLPENMYIPKGIEIMLSTDEKNGSSLDSKHRSISEQLQACITYEN